MSDALVILRAAFPGAGEWHSNPHGSWWSDDLGVEVHVGSPPGEPTGRFMAELRVKDAGWILGFGADAPAAVMDAILCRIARSAVDYDRAKCAAQDAEGMPPVARHLSADQTVGHEELRRATFARAVKHDRKESEE